ncbi:MAG: hypothetical protein IJQ98_05355 [Oscillospiraceae bacterium]|nr:hypothetical protein [Oscillospiraceae bacterium]
MSEIIDIDTGRKILDEVRDKQYPSMRRAARGYALVLLYNMTDRETEAKKLRAVPHILDGLIDFGLTDEAMSFFVELCARYDVMLAPTFLRYAVIGSMAKSFVIEFYIAFRDLMEELEPELKGIGL